MTSKLMTSNLDSLKVSSPLQNLSFEKAEGKKPQKLKNWHSMYGPRAGRMNVSPQLVHLALNERLLPKEQGDVTAQ